MNYTTVDRLFSRFSRELRGVDLNETDIIEWIGDALDFLKTPEIQEQAVAFMKVTNHETSIPEGFKAVLQIARYNNLDEEVCQEPGSKNDIDCQEEDSIQKTPKKDIDPNCVDCLSEEEMRLILKGGFEYRPYFDMQWQYIPWTVSKFYKRNFTPVRLSNHTLYNTLVCKEKSIYETDCCGQDEYTIVGTVDKKLRLSFKEGEIAMSYLRSAVDPETGYPLIPDEISHITAISYYVRWKIAEYQAWNGREGFANIAADNERLWLKYVKQAKNIARMPKTLDQYQNLLEQSHYLIPRHKMYYNFFGKLGKPEDRRFSNPDHRLKHRYYAR